MPFEDLKELRSQFEGTQKRSPAPAAAGVLLILPSAQWLFLDLNASRAPRRLAMAQAKPARSRAIAAATTLACARVFDSAGAAAAAPGQQEI
jgi:hypothetical protein